MKSFVFVVIVIAAFKEVSAQPLIINTTFAKSDSNIIYSGIQNIFKISGIDDYPNIELKASKLTVIKPKDPFTFNVEAQNTGSEILYLMKNKKIIFQKMFEIISIPEVTAIIGAIQDSVASTKQIILNPFLRAIRPNCNCSVGHVIGRFQITFVSKQLDNSEKVQFVNGQSFKHLTAIIKRLQPNDKIIFDKISTIDIDSRSLLLRSVTITIK